MSTMLELKQTVAGVLRATVADFTVNGVDFQLMAANKVRLHAEQLHDFEFTKRLVSIVVNTVTGGSLTTAVLYGTATAANIKQILSVGQMDDDANFRPVEWMTSEEAYDFDRHVPVKRRFLTAPIIDSRYQLRSCCNQPVVTFTGDSVFVRLKPVSTDAQDITLVIEAYCYSADWTTQSNTITVSGGTGVTGVNNIYYRYGNYQSYPLYLDISPTTLSTGAAIYALWHNGFSSWFITTANQFTELAPTNYHSLASTSQSPAGTYSPHGTFTGTAVAVSADVDSTSDIWLTKGFDYMLWAMVVWLNHNGSAVFGKTFVQRQEGNLAPPTELRDAALEVFFQNDQAKFEANRRHVR